MSTQATVDTEYKSINPATGELIKAFPEQTDEEVFAALTTADNCYHNYWKLRSIAGRAKIMARAAEIFREKADEYARYMALDMGKIRDQAIFEVNLSADILAYYASHAEKFLNPGAPPHKR